MAVGESEANETLPFCGQNPSDMPDDQLIAEDAHCRQGVVRLVLLLSSQLDTSTAYGPLYREHNELNEPAIVQTANLLTKTARRQRVLNAELLYNKSNLSRVSIFTLRLSTPLVLVLLLPILPALESDVMEEVISTFISPNGERREFLRMPQKSIPGSMYESLKPCVKDITQGIAGTTDAEAHMGFASSTGYQESCNACHKTINSGFPRFRYQDFELCRDCCGGGELMYSRQHLHTPGEDDTEQERIRSQRVLESLRRERMTIIYCQVRHQRCQVCSGSLISQTTTADLTRAIIIYEVTKPCHWDHKFDIIVNTDELSQADYAARIFLQSADMRDIITAGAAIRTYKQILGLTSDNHDQTLPMSKQIEVAKRLIELMDCRIENYLNPDFIEESFYIRMKLSCIPAQEVSILLRTTHVIGLVENYLLQFEVAADPADLGAAIAMSKKLLDFRSDIEDSAYCRMLGYMTGAYFARYIHAGNLVDLEEAFRCADEAVVLSETLQMEPKPAYLYLIYVKVLLAQFEISQDKATVDEAIKHGVCASPRIQGEAYLARYKAYQNKADLERAIDLLRRDLELAEEKPRFICSWLTGHSAYYESKGSLAAAYLAAYSFDRTTASSIDTTQPKRVSACEVPVRITLPEIPILDPLPAILSETIKLLKSAAEEVPLSRSAYSLYRAQLARVFVLLYNDFLKIELLDYAAKLYKLALDETPKLSPYRAARLYELGQAYLKRSELHEGQDSERAKQDCSEAQDVLREALELTAKSDPMHATLRSVIMIDYETAFKTSPRKTLSNSKVLHQAVDRLTHLVQISNLTYFLLAPTPQALGTVKQCLNFDPDSRECRNAHKTYRRLDKGQSKLERTVDANDWRGLAKLVTGGGKGGGLAEDFDTALKEGTKYLHLPTSIVPKKHSLRRQRIYWGACKAYTMLEMPAKADVWCSEVLVMDPEDADALEGKAAGLMAKEEWEEAVRTLEKAFELSGRTSRSVMERLEKARRLLKQSRNKDYYKVLGVARDADEKTIKKAYEAKMAAVNEACEVLLNPELRAQFDNGDDPNDPTSGQGHRFPGGFPGE
ncbi:DnaJ domain protein [Ceratobasidium sp. AG-Ba]|nr:DnaJ domain protein [Ceratobasidium sp. AG-Ba]